MPTSATHITVVRRIAASGGPYRGLLGDPDPTLSPSDPAAQKMRFASLGSCGPDFLYMLMDYGPEAQDLENILVKNRGDVRRPRRPHGRRAGDGRRRDEHHHNGRH